LWKEFPTNPINALEASHRYENAIKGRGTLKFPTNPINALEASRTASSRGVSKPCFQLIQLTHWKRAW